MRRYWLVCGLLAGVLLAVSHSVRAAASEPTAESNTGAVTQPASLDIAGGSQRALLEIRNVTAVLDPLGDVSQEQTLLTQLNDRFMLLVPADEPVDEWITSLSQAEFNSLQVELSSINNGAGSLLQRLTSQASKIEQGIATVRLLSRNWQEVLENQEDLAESLKERILDVQARGTALLTSSNSKLNAVAELQSMALDLQRQVQQAHQQLRTLVSERKRQLLIFTEPPIWAAQKSRPEVPGTGLRGILHKPAEDIVRFAELQKFEIATLFALLALMLWWTGYARKSALLDHETSTFINQPVSTGLLVWLLLILIVFPLPATLQFIVRVLTLLVGVRVLTSLLPVQLLYPVYLGAGLYIIDALLSGADTTLFIPRLLLLLLGTGALFISLAVYRKQHIAALVSFSGLPAIVHAFSMRSLSAIATVGLLTNIFGNVLLAQLLISGTVRSFITFFVIFASRTILIEALNLTLASPLLTGFRSLSNHRQKIVQGARKPFILGGLFLWIWATLTAFDLEATAQNAVVSLLAAGWTIGNVDISVGRIVSFVLAVRVSIWISRITRTLLQEDVLPNMLLPRGVPHTISVSVHYAIMLFGLLIAAGFLGVNMSSLTLIVGALGVGIGFGLQNLVNNFISGLILIFERPIQIGDAVQVGELFGRVTQIGLRASRVQTFSGSEVVVPNGDLVSNQLVNWTLTDRRRRLELTIGVKYGTDPEKVISLLLEAIAQDDGILTEPAPMIIFEEFGDSALQFRAYVWIANFDDGLPTRSRLMTAFNRTLLNNGIEIPFPQRDLHLKSVAADASFSIRPNPFGIGVDK
ncbi:MAG: mechanosensitive ion channel [Proteobacteria bacterium]|nr:mechanosensitive ion channel [Pseudomonadota bacterium]